MYNATSLTEMRNMLPYQAPPTDDPSIEPPAPELPEIDTNSVPATTDATMEKYKQLQIDEFPLSWYGVIVGSRRSGKTTMAEHLIRQAQQSRKHKFTHIWLISQTNAGFEPGIPKRFRSRDMATLDFIAQKQIEVMKYNRKQRHKRDMIRQKVLVIVDDCAATAGQCLRNSVALDSAALNGRHLSSRDPIESNGVSYLVLSQSLTAISRRQRLNVDFFIVNSLSSDIETRMICEENGFFTNTAGGKREGRQLFRMLTTSKEWRFICIMCCAAANKTDLHDYVRLVDAEIPSRPRQFFGTASDDEGDSD